EWVSFARHDAFRTSYGLGKPACEIWYCLSHMPKLSITEIAKKLLRDRRTVKNALTRLSRIVDLQTGEIIRMVEQNCGLWEPVQDIDLDHVAHALGTSGARQRDIARHQLEREAYRLRLA